MTRKTLDIPNGYYTGLPYASGVRVSGPLLYTSGLTSRDDDGAVVAPGDMAAQFEQTFHRLAQVAAAAGTDLDHLVKLTIYVTDIDRAYAAPEQWRRYFAARPASTLVEVSRLAPDILVEIEAVLEIPDGATG